MVQFLEAPHAVTVIKKYAQKGRNVVEREPRALCLVIENEGGGFSFDM